jgi:hypothetical protein
MGLIASYVVSEMSFPNCCRVGIIEWVVQQDQQPGADK